MSSSIKISVLLIAAAIFPAYPQAPEGGDRWRQADQILDRLQEEKRTLVIIEEEVGRLKFLAEDLRGLQLYPSEVTRLRGEDEIWLDKRIERLERNHAAALQFVEEGKRPLGEALSITREMLRIEPNADMIEILRKDNISRAERLLKTQKRLNGYWDEASGILESLWTRSGFAADKVENQLFDQTFLKVLMSNLGRASERFYVSFNDYKDSLVVRSETKNWARMAKIDLDRLEQRLGSVNAEWVESELASLSGRFHGKIAIGAIHYHLARSYFLAKKPLQSTRMFQEIAADSRFYGPSRLGILQGFFEAKLDDSVVVHYREMVERNQLSATDLASARYLVVQSYYALGADSLIAPEILLSNQKDAYHHKGLLVYAKSLVRQSRFTEARKVLEGLVSQAQLPQKFQGQIRMMLAHLNYEEGLFSHALRGYTALLEWSGFQSEALYGMVWCSIRLQDLDGAEFILKKLISQYPDHTWALDGFLVLIRRIALKSAEEWEFLLQVEEGRERLEQSRKKLEQRLKDGLLPEALAGKVREQLVKMEEQLSRHKPMRAEQIGALYRQAVGLCEFIEQRYRSGEYSEVVYSDEREKMLWRLERVAGAQTTLNFENLDGSEEWSNNRPVFRKKLFESRALAMDLQVRQKAWLKDYLIYSQKKLSALNQSITGDTPESLRQKKNLESQAYRLADDISERLVRKGERILSQIDKISATTHAGPFVDWMLFQSGMQRYDLEEHELRKRWMSFQWLNQQNDGNDVFPEPSIRFLEYEAPWNLLVESYPESPHAPAALYYLGFSKTGRGNSLEGLKHFQELAEKYPESPYTHQALIFIGEHYFNQNQLAEAERAYDRVLDYPESKYFEQALYKLAWTRYRLNSYKGAISSFTYILEEAAGNRNPAKKSVLTAEALQFAALSMAESDTTGDGGLAQTKAFADKLGDTKLGAQLIHRMAIIYAQQGRLDRASQAVETLMKNYEHYERHFEVAMELARAYDREKKFEAATDVRMKVFRRVNPRSEWRARQTDPEVIADADAACRQAMEEVAMHYLWQAKQIKESGGSHEQEKMNLFKAVSAYENLLSAYPEDEQRSKYGYNQAEAYYAMEEYAQAVKMYVKVSAWSNGEYRLLAAYNAIVAAQELVRKSQGGQNE